jgi:hypothetical protein
MTWGPAVSLAPGTPATSPAPGSASPDASPTPRGQASPGHAIVHMTPPMEWSRTWMRATMMKYHYDFVLCHRTSSRQVWRWGGSVGARCRPFGGGHRVNIVPRGVGARVLA